MGIYLIKKIFFFVLLLFFSSIIVFILVELSPGDSANLFLPEESRRTLQQEERRSLENELGLNIPLPWRYFPWLKQILKGNFGFSFIEKKPVRELLSTRGRNSLILLGTGFFFSLLIGIPLGIFLALRPHSFWNFFLNTISSLALSMPVFLAGILGLYFFAFKWPIFPTGGMYSLLGDQSVSDLLAHLILPGLILSLIPTAQNIRYSRFSILDIIKNDYIIAAKAKGLQPQMIISRHALPNALFPLIVVIGFSLPLLFVGSIFLETIYTWPGLGTSYYQAVLSKDYPVIMGINLVIVVFITTTNFFLDILYTLLDPRIRYTEAA